ncbi:MAG: hypothetical protein JOZ75_03685 [Candidatus Dormibacteraeota bacterium]|nr:hypothetical protein [Candidatus Dormibacteraeota bacterium]
MRVARVDAGGGQEGWVGAVLARDVLDDSGHVALAKGHRLVAGDAGVIAGDELHIVWLDADDVDEDTAATRLAHAVAGPGVERHPPVESQVRLSATRRGIVRVDVDALASVNGVDGVTVFTLEDGTPVDAQRTIGGAKVTSLAIARAALEQALTRASAAHGPIVGVRAFEPLRLGAVVRQRLGEHAQAKLESNLQVRADWFGGSLGAIAHVGDDSADIAAALRTAMATSDIVLAAGVASVDPLDPTWRALLEAGATPIRRGLAVHPGSSYWLASCGAALVIGVASCGMLSRRSALDLLLVRRFTGEPIDDAFLTGLGHGGLLGPEAAWRIPPYGTALQAVED